MRFTIVAAALAAASLSLAFSPALAAHDGSPSDPTGAGGVSHQGRVATDLGVNITLAGNTHAEVQRNSWPSSSLTPGISSSQGAGTT